MKTLEELNEIQLYLTNIIYHAHQLDKSIPAQSTYGHLVNMKDIGLKRARPDVNNVDTIKSGFKDISEILEFYKELNPDFIEGDLALRKLVKFANYVSGVFVGRTRPIAVKEKETDDIEVLKQRLKEARETIKQWETGWLAGESTKNTEYHRTLEKVKDLVEEGSYEEALSAASIQLVKGRVLYGQE